MEWYQIKTALSQVTGISQDAFHILVAVGIQLVFALILRSGVSAFRPWLIVLLLELANEWSDLSFDIWPDRAWQIGESIKDVVITMIVPTALLILARRRPGLLEAPPERGAGEADPAE